MKRSEMINILKDALLYRLARPPYDISDRELSSVLSALEEVGMTPPETQIEYVREFNGTVISWNKFERKWEPE